MVQRPWERRSRARHLRGAPPYNARTMTQDAPTWADALFDRIYAAYNAQDAAATRECYADDLEFRINGEPGPESREAFVEALQEQWRGFPDIRARETFRLRHGDVVVTEMVIHGRNSAPFLGRPATGNLWHVTLAWICRVGAGRVQSVHAFVDNLPLRNAVGAG